MTSNRVIVYLYFIQLVVFGGQLGGSKENFSGSYYKTIVGSR